MRPTKSSQVLTKPRKFNFGSQNDLRPSHSAGELRDLLTTMACTPTLFIKMKLTANQSSCHFSTKNVLCHLHLF